MCFCACKSARHWTHGKPPASHRLQLAVQGFVRTTTKYWVIGKKISDLKYQVLQHLPVFQFNPDPNDKFPADAQLVNSVYLDNSVRELYHGRIDKRPGAIAMRIRWCAPVLTTTRSVLIPIAVWQLASHTHIGSLGLVARFMSHPRRTPWHVQVWSGRS
jgi:SPX domain protein involved in polyphosphate accumulation